MKFVEHINDFNAYFRENQRENQKVVRKFNAEVYLAYLTFMTIFLPFYN